MNILLNLKNLPQVPPGGATRTPGSESLLYRVFQKSWPLEYFNLYTT